jgi:hypothetical protein
MASDYGAVADLGMIDERARYIDAHGGARCIVHLYMYIKLFDYKKMGRSIGLLMCFNMCDRRELVEVPSGLGEIPGRPIPRLRSRMTPY